MMVAMDSTQATSRTVAYCKKSGLTSMLPIPNKSPAAGRIATGNINALPTLCKTPKSFLNILEHILSLFEKQQQKGTSFIAVLLFVL
ncbi:hypothetical protein D3C76_994900 [compost metagenome]